MSDEIDVPDDLTNLFAYHAPTLDQVCRHNALRESALLFAQAIDKYCPPGPDRTAAIRKVREALMTANSGIATGGGFYR